MALAGSDYPGDFPGKGLSLALEWGEGIAGNSYHPTQGE